MDIDELDFITSQLSKQDKKQKSKVVKKSKGKKKVDETAGCTQCVTINAYNAHQCAQSGVTFQPVKCASCYSKLNQNSNESISLSAGQERDSTGTYQGYQFSSYAYGQDPQAMYQAAYQQGYQASYQAAYQAGYQAGYQAAQEEAMAAKIAADKNPDVFDANQYAEKVRQQKVQANVSSMNRLLDSIDRQNDVTDSTPDTIYSQRDNAPTVTPVSKVAEPVEDTKSQAQVKSIPSPPSQPSPPPQPVPPSQQSPSTPETLQRSPSPSRSVAPLTKENVDAPTTSTQPACTQPAYPPAQEDPSSSSCCPTDCSCSDSSDSDNEKAPTSAPASVLSQPPPMPVVDNPAPVAVVESKPHSPTTPSLPPVESVDTPLNAIPGAWHGDKDSSIAVLPDPEAGEDADEDEKEGYVFQFNQKRSTDILGTTDKVAVSGQAGVRVSTHSCWSSSSSSRSRSRSKGRSNSPASRHLSRSRSGARDRHRRDDRYSYDRRSSRDYSRNRYSSYPKRDRSTSRSPRRKVKKTRHKSRSPSF
jgi:hypothetical protein